jgi:hypothetical protein
MSASSQQRPNKASAWRWVVGPVVGVLVVVGAALLLWPAVRDAREAARRASCIGQMKFFGLGMLNYHDAHGCFPPAYFADAEGRPAHSWRVVLLPEQEETALYERYRFDEAWNSPHNRALADGLPIGMSGVVPWYHCPTDRDSDWLDTSFVIVVGPATFSPGPTGRRLADFTDGSSHTIAIAEMAESGIPWMEPRDLDFDHMSFHVNDWSRPSIRSRHPGIANAMFGDASVRSIHEDIDPEVLKGLLTADGGEPVGEFFTEP